MFCKMGMLFRAYVLSKSATVKHGYTFRAGNSNIFVSLLSRGQLSNPVALKKATGLRK